MSKDKFIALEARLSKNLNVEDCVINNNSKSPKQGSGQISQIGQGLSHNHNNSPKTKTKMSSHEERKQTPNRKLNYQHNQHNHQTEYKVVRNHNDYPVVMKQISSSSYHSGEQQQHNINTQIELRGEDRLAGNQCQSRIDAHSCKPHNNSSNPYSRISGVTSHNSPSKEKNSSNVNQNSSSIGSISSKKEPRYSDGDTGGGAGGGVTPSGIPNPQKAPNTPSSNHSSATISKRNLTPNSSSANLATSNGQMPKRRRKGNNHRSSSVSSNSGKEKTTNEQRSLEQPETQTSERHLSMDQNYNTPAYREEQIGTVRDSGNSVERASSTEPAMGSGPSGPTSSLSGSISSNQKVQSQSSSKSSNLQTVMEENQNNQNQKQIQNLQTNPYDQNQNMQQQHHYQSHLTNRDTTTPTNNAITSQKIQDGGREMTATATTTTPSNKSRAQQKEIEITKNNRKITDYWNGQNEKTPSGHNYIHRPVASKPGESIQSNYEGVQGPTSQVQGHHNLGVSSNLSDNMRMSYAKSSNDLFNCDSNKSPPKITSEMLHAPMAHHLTNRPPSRGRMSEQQPNQNLTQTQNTNTLNAPVGPVKPTEGPVQSNSANPQYLTNMKPIPDTKTISTQTEMTLNTISTIIQQNSELEELKHSLEENRILGLRHREILLKNDVEKKRMLNALKNALIEQAKTERRHARDKVGRNRIRLGYLTKSNCFNNTNSHGTMDSWTHGTWLEQLELKKIKNANEKEAIEREKKNLRFEGFFLDINENPW